MPLNETHNAARKSWVESANAPQCPFPIQNLPFGIFSTAQNPNKRAGIAIGDQVLDLAVLEKTGILKTPHAVFDRSDLNSFMGLGPDVWSMVRKIVSDELANETSDLRLYANVLTPLDDVQLHLPVSVGGYTDFYASREHATNVGSLFRDPDNALMPNWLHMPIGYNGRASTLVVSGVDVIRPMGQTKRPEQDQPVFSASQKLDMELEVAAVVGTPSPMGASVTLNQAQDMIFGFALMNDWSARDIQVWEYQPLGPFLGKAFATTLSPWIVTREALEPFRVAGPEQVPQPLPYLRQSVANNYDIHLFAHLNGEQITKTNFRTMYWSCAQQLAHHASGGCAMNSGDVLGSGTISGSDPGTMGSLLELTWNGKTPMKLASGETRTFIEDGDEVSLTGFAQGEGYQIGFGDATAKVLPAIEATT